MRRIGTMVLVMGLIALCISPALGQQGRGKRGGGGMFGGGGGLGQLLRNESVQKELKLDSDQVEKVKALTEKVTANHQEDFAKLREASREEQREKGMEIGKAVNAEIKKELPGILKPEQSKRLDQIDLQEAGVRAFTRPEVDKALNLSADQKDKIKTISDDLAKDMRELRGGGGGGGGRRGGNFEKVAGLNKEALEKVQSVLTPDQKKTWKDMTGEKFTIVRQFPGGGRGKRNQDQ